MGSFEAFQSVFDENDLVFVDRSVFEKGIIGGDHMTEYHMKSERFDLEFQGGFFRHDDRPYDSDLIV